MPRITSLRVIVEGIAVVIALFRWSRNSRWSEWQESSMNRHVWSHAKTAYRFCRDCGQEERKVVDVDCTKMKRVGRWCEGCADIVRSKAISNRVLDISQANNYNIIMETIERKNPKIVFVEETERNKQVYTMKEAGRTYSEIAETFGISRARVEQIIRRYKQKMAIS